MNDFPYVQCVTNTGQVVAVLLFNCCVSLCPVQIQQLHDMEEVCYNKVLEQVKAGHQVRALLQKYTNDYILYMHSFLGVFVCG